MRIQDSRNDRIKRTISTLPSRAMKETHLCLYTESIPKSPITKENRGAAFPLETLKCHSSLASKSTSVIRSIADAR